MRLLFSKLKSLLPGAILFAIVAILFVGVFLLLAISGGAIMSIIGLEYRSVGSVILFFFISAIVATPIGELISALPKVLVKAGRLSKWQGTLLFLIEDTIFSIIVFSIVDYFMSSVEASPLAILVVSFLLALLSVYVDENELPDDDEME